jgi:hypothetical protein
MRVEDLEIVSGRPFSTTCCQCGRRISNEPRQVWDDVKKEWKDVSVPIYADTKGPAYQSYVCNACAEELAKEVSNESKERSS